jgi:hypothetical protein
MAQATLQLNGSYTLTPPSYPPSASQTIGSPICETSYVQRWSPGQVDLLTDGPTAIPLPVGATNINFLYMKVQGGSPVDLILTSADGSQQIVPVDSLSILYFNNRPVTAVAVTRTPGVEANLTYLIAQNQ